MSPNDPAGPPHSRRTLLAGLAAAGVAGAAGGLAPRAALAQQQADRFLAAYRAALQVLPVQSALYETALPDRRMLSVRVTWPVEVPDTLSVIALSPGTGVNAVRYDTLAGMLAGQGFLVVAPSHQSMASDTPSSRELRRIGELRFALDQIRAIRAVLGPDAERVVDRRMGVAGHADGAWTALGLGGWSRRLTPDSAVADGRVAAVFALAPTPQPPPVPAGRPYDPGATPALIAGQIDRLPPPPADSGVLGLGLPPHSASFGGLIGAGAPARGEAGRADAQAQRRVLAAAAAAAGLFFQRHLNGQDAAGRALDGLDGRIVEGLSAPLQLRRA